MPKFLIMALAGLHMSIAMVFGSVESLASDRWHADAENGLTDLLEEIRAEKVDGGACGAPPRAPGDTSSYASGLFYEDVQAWDRCQRNHLDDLEDRVVDFRYQLENWLPELPQDHPLVARAFRTIDIFNRRVARARDRAARDYEYLASAEADYADRQDTVVRQDAWAQIEEDQRISDICMAETTANFSAFSETLYDCIERKKHENQMLAAGYSPYISYDPDHHADDYNRVKIVVNVYTDENGEYWTEEDRHSPHR